MSNLRYPFAKSWRWQLVRLFDCFADVFFNWNSKKAFPKEIKNILLVRLDQIGDVICFLPVLPMVRALYPKAKITVLTAQESKSLFENNPYVDKALVFSPNWFSRSNEGVLSRMFDLISKLQDMEFDLGFDFRGDVRNILLMVLSGVRYRIGYDVGGGRGFLNHAASFDERLHQSELNARLLGFKTEKEELRPEFFLTAEEKTSSFRMLSCLGVSENDRLIVIHPEAGYPAKEWGMDAFDRLVGLLISKTTAKVLIVGLKEARALSQEYRGSNRVIDLVGKISLRELACVLYHSHILIGNDSGPSHMAQAVGLPVIAIASGTNVYERWGVWREPKRILKYEVPCAPCHLSHCVVEGHPCMTKISVETVFKAVEELLHVKK